MQLATPLCLLALASGYAFPAWRMLPMLYLFTLLMTLINAATNCNAHQPFGMLALHGTMMGRTRNPRGDFQHMGPVHWLLYAWEVSMKLLRTWSWRGTPNFRLACKQRTAMWCVVLCLDFLATSPCTRQQCPARASKHDS